MSEWKKYKLSEITELVIDYRGKTPKKLGGNWSNTGYRALSAKNIKTGMIVNPENIRYCDEDLYKKWMKDEVKRGDILITSEAPFGQILYWDSDEKIVLSQRIFDVRIKSQYSSKFIYYYMTTSEFQSDLDSRATGTTVVGLRQPELLKCTVKCPDYSIQVKIAKYLSSLDDKIELNNKINKNLEQQAQALFKHWFVDFEFPNDDGKPYKSSGGVMVDSEIGEIPEGWRLKSLDEIAEFLNGIACQKYPPEDIENSLPVIKIRELNSHSLEGSDRASKNIPNQYFIKNGDVIFSWSGSLMIDIWCYGEGILNQHLFKVTSNDYPKWFYYLWSNYHLFEFQNIAKDKTTTMGHIQRKDLHDAKVLIPPQKTIDKMNPIMENLVDLQISNDIENSKLTVMRDELLPKLMSGEINV